jgi:hypothetical protein
MQDHKKMIGGYERRQAELRRQISVLKAGTLGDDGAIRAAAIRRTERQIDDLGRAIARLREASPT